MKKYNNKGFSLVELIIVIAIMAVLVGVVGTQVLPYMENARRAKDVQILSAYVTAGMAAYSYHPDNAPTSGTMEVVIVSDAGADVYTCDEAQEIADELKRLINRDYITDAARAFSSKDYVMTEKIIVTYDFDGGTITVTAYDGFNVLIPSEHAISGRL